MFGCRKDSTYWRLIQNTKKNQEREGKVIILFSRRDLKTCKERERIEPLAWQLDSPVNLSDGMNSARPLIKYKCQERSTGPIIQVIGRVAHIHGIKQKAEGTQYPSCSLQNLKDEIFVGFFRLLTSALINTDTGQSHTENSRPYCKSFFALGKEAYLFCYLALALLYV